jgi:hypothetical protein
MNLNRTKSILSITTLIAAIVSFSGCDLFDKVDEVSIPAELEVIWTADENGEMVDFEYAKSATVKLTDNAEISTHIDKIKDVKINKITYRITDYNDDPHHEAVILKNGHVHFNSNGSTTTVVNVPFAASAADVNLKTSVDETELAIDAAGLTTLANLLKTEKELEMSSSGTISRTPVSFKVVSTFHVTVTAELLD